MAHCVCAAWCCEWRSERVASLSCRGPLLGDCGFGTLIFMNFAPSKLFHAVVITGAALTGCAGVTQKPTPSDPSTAAKPTPATATPSASTGTCPPGSERPFPPCYWIK